MSIDISNTVLILMAENHYFQYLLETKDQQNPKAHGEQIKEILKSFICHINTIIPMACSSYLMDTSAGHKKI